MSLLDGNIFEEEVKKAWFFVPKMIPIWFTKTLKWLFVNALNTNVLSRKDVQKRLLYSLLPIRSRLFSSLYLHHKIFDN